MEIIEKPIRKVFTMKSYLENLRDDYIREDQDVQRAAGQYSYNMNNELVFTVLSDDYVPPIILGEDLDFQKWIIDGLQRSTCFKLFRFGNYKITSLIKDSIVYYRQKAETEDGKTTWEFTEYDIKGKTFDMLPKELQMRFDEYQVETVIHEKCSTERISELVRRYNNHKAMSVSQRALTSIGRYAREIKQITENKFFTECGSYNEKTDRINGTMERIVMESVMCSNHFDKWKANAEKMAEYLDDNAINEEFEIFNSDLERLQVVVGNKCRELFNGKNSFIWFSLFRRFSQFGIKDKKFADFLEAFNKGYGQEFNKMDINKGTKDKKVVASKLEFLENLMMEYLHINIEEKQPEETNPLLFTQENVQSDTTSEDMDFYNDMLLDLSMNVDNSSKLLDKQNEPSMLAIVAYGCQNDIDLDEWFITYFDRNNTYLPSQKQNYLHMKQDLRQWLSQKEKVSA